MRYILSGRLRPERARDLLRALDDGSFARGFPYGDLGEVLLSGRVDASGTIRWIEVCYCREAYGVAMEEELPYFQEFLSDITIADARNPKTCKGYPECGTCDCTRGVRLSGEEVRGWIERVAAGLAPDPRSPREGTRWLGWRGRVTAEEARRTARAARAREGVGSGANDRPAEPPDDPAGRRRKRTHERGS